MMSSRPSFLGARASRPLLRQCKAKIKIKKRGSS
jgi:hypothetical protein